MSQKNAWDVLNEKVAMLRIESQKRIDDGKRLDWLTEQAKSGWLKHGNCAIDGDLRKWVDEMMKEKED